MIFSIQAQLISSWFLNRCPFPLVQTSATTCQEDFELSPCLAALHKTGSRSECMLILSSLQSMRKTLLSPGEVCSVPNLRCSTASVQCCYARPSKQFRTHLFAASQAVIKISCKTLGEGLIKSGCIASLLHLVLRTCYSALERKGMVWNYFIKPWNAGWKGPLKVS